MSEKYSTIHQHEPLRTPSEWGTPGKRYTAQLEELFDDLYSRLNRLKLTDLSKSLRTIITESADGVQTNRTAIEQTNKQIKLLASQENLNELTGLVNKHESRITQNANAISLKVSAGDIASSINQTAQSVLIDASKINLSGYVTISSLGDGGTTAIDGSRITTGTVAAARIDVDNLHVKHLNGADGTFSGSLTAETTYCNNLLLKAGYQMRVGNIVVNENGLYFTYGGNIDYSHWWVDIDTYGESHMHTDGSFYIDSHPNYPMILTAGNFWFYITQNSYGIGFDSYYGYSEVSFLPADDRTCNIGCGPISSQGVASRIFDYAGIRYIYCPDGVHAGSSRTIKHDIEPIDDVSSIIDALVAVRFKLNDDKKDKTRVGLIYEDTKDILPEICDEQVAGDMSTAGIDYAALTPILLKEVQSLRSRVSELEAASKI